MRAAMLSCLLAMGCATTSPPPGANLEASAAGKLIPLEPGAPGLVERARGQVLVVDFWASWCEPCRSGFPRLDRLAKAYEGRGLVVVGVDVGEDREVVQAFLRDVGVSYFQYMDPGFALADHLGSRSLPSVYVFDRDGRVVAKGDGLTPQLLEIVRGLIDTGDAALGR